MSTLDRNLAQPKPAPLNTPHFLHHERNEYMTWRTKLLCGACGRTFTVTPAITDPTEPAWDNCMAPECPSYTIDRDVEALMVTDGITLHCDAT